ncbi:MAG TPA: FecR family protein, partial [Aggregatilineaceae bacterium]|nr:FecR family protein [Aggregatilineaceae bacterium]
MISHRRNWVSRIGVLIVLALAVGSASVPVRAAVPVPAAQESAVATLAVTLGSATLTPVEGELQELQTEDVAVVQVGDQIAVSEDGEALLTFFEGVESRIAPASTVKVDRFETSDSGSQIGLSLVLGQTLNNVEGLADSSSSFEINTPAASITVRGTRFAVFARASELTQVATLDGTVQVAAQGRSTDLPYGLGVKLMPGE